MDLLNDNEKSMPLYTFDNTSSESLQVSDSDWSTISEWSLSSSLNNSPILPSAHISSLSTSIPRPSPIAAPQSISPISYIDQHTPYNGFAPPHLPLLHFDGGMSSLMSRSRSGRSMAGPVESSPRIPRPPNAFMLFRSDFLARKVIPQHVERRQQNLSRIAGECWHLLSETEKAKWHAKAKEALENHRAKYPSYKFTPNTRKKGSAHRDRNVTVECESSERKSRTRELRELYTGLGGPAMQSPRRRKASPPCKVKTEERDIDFLAAMRAYLPSSLPLSINSTPSPAPSSSSNEAPLSELLSSSQPGGYAFDHNFGFLPPNPTLWNPYPSPNEMAHTGNASALPGVASFLDHDATPTVATFRSVPDPSELPMLQYPSGLASPSPHNVTSSKDTLGLRELHPLHFDYTVASSSSARHSPDHHSDGNEEKPHSPELFLPHFDSSGTMLAELEDALLRPPAFVSRDWEMYHGSAYGLDS